MLKIIGGMVVYGFALYGLLRFLYGRSAPRGEGCWEQS